jgi:hypothetical protein
VSRYPKLVKGWSDLHPADRAICQKCEKERTWNPEAGDPYDLCIKHHGCGGQIVMKYDTGVACRGCGKLDYSMAVEGCCSRKCMLQAEYAESLKAATA